jgi:hypothetical protein
MSGANLPAETEMTRSCRTTPELRLASSLALIGASILLALGISPLALAQEEVDFAGLKWQISGQVKVGEHLGRESLLMRTGAASLPDLQFRDGIIEFDVATTGHRSFAGAPFRIDEAGPDYEDFYLRPHNSGRFDAMQYAPVYNGIAAWQLYPEHNAAFEIPTEKWIHVRMVVAGSRLEVFLDGATEPSLVVERLRGRQAAGTIALKSFFPAGTPADLYPTAFSAFAVHPVEPPIRFTAETTAPPDSGMISHWSLSPAFPTPGGPVEELPTLEPSSGSWQTAVSDETGRVNLARYRGLQEGARRGAVLARVTLHSDREQTRKLNFGFSDQVGVFLNGRLLFTGDNTYRTRSQKYLGVMTVDHAALYLPLRKGSNELIFAVSEAFGGWGLIGRLQPGDGLRVEVPDGD